MVITDLFSHKIHSSGPDWPDKLVELAFIFNRFDGTVYDRAIIENELRQISPRVSYAASDYTASESIRDLSKFRDEISAYPAYLGLYHLEPSHDGVRIFISETAKRFLIREEPDVGAYLRIQLTLFQYPNGMGAAGNLTRIVPNARDRTLNYISQGMHLSPLRLICKALQADSLLKSCDIFDSIITFKEIYALANCADVNTTASPSLNDIVNALSKIRSGEILPPESFEHRFQILKHTELFQVERGEIRLRDVNRNDENDRNDVLNKFNLISEIQQQFTGFDRVTNEEELKQSVFSGQWGRWFDGVLTLPFSIINGLTEEHFEISYETPIQNASQQSIVSSQSSPSIYPFMVRGDRLPIPAISNRTRELADPEITRIKRQKRNLDHKLLVDRMDQLLKSKGAMPRDNPHVDLYAEIPDDGAFLFEMKSGGENYLDQIRKGISQLYEYRFRYQTSIREDSNLCLVLSREIQELEWLYDFVCEDRGIGICWFENDSLVCPSQCEEMFGAINT